MTKEIKPGEIGRIDPSFKVNDFRQMVNYKSGTNKGYVRFTRTSDGGLKLEKFNNKVDVRLSWRSNVGATNNRLMRQKFVDAMKGDLKYVGDTRRNHIRDMVLTPRNDVGEVQKGKALSRIDIKEALEAFDRAFNTSTGRMEILNNFFKVAMKECGFKGTEEEFKRDFLKLDAHGLNDEALMQYSTSKEGMAKGPADAQMVKSEVEFRALIAQLEERLGQAKLYMNVDSNIKDLARLCIKKGDCFGLDLMGQDGGKFISDLRSSLTQLLTARGVKDVDMTVDSSLNKALDTFLAKVLPFYIQNGVVIAREFAGDDPVALEEVLDANFDFETLVDLAAEFVKGAAEAALKPNKPLDQVEKNAIMMTMAYMEDTKTRVDIYDLTANTIVKRAAITGKMADDLAKEVARNTYLFRAEANIDNYAARFVIKHFSKGTENQLPKKVDEKDKVKEFINQKLVPALQLQYGERHFNSATGRYSQGAGNVQHFIKAMTDQIAYALNEYGGGRKLYENLFTHTLPNILNHRIETSALSEGRERLHLDEVEDLKDAMNKIDRTALAYINFTEKKLERMLAQSLQGYQKLLTRQSNKGNINKDDYANLMGDFRGRLEEASQRAIKRFFERSPLPVYSDNLYNDADEGVKLLTQLLNEEKNAVISEMTQRLNTAVLAHSANVAVKRKLMNEGVVVNGIIDSLAGRQPPLDTQLTGPALRHGLNKLYYQVLNKQLNDRKVSKAPVDEQFVTKVQEAFTKEANDFVKKAEKYAEQLETTLRKTVADDIEARIKGDGSTTLQDHAKLGKAELKDVINALTEDVMLAQHKRLGALKERYLENPETYAKMKAEDAIEKEFSVDESQQNIRRTVIATAKERIYAVAEWYKEKDEHGFDLSERHLQNEALNLGKAYPKLTKAEVGNLAKATVEPVMKRISDYPILYSIGGKDKFTERVNQEIKTSSEAHMKTYMAFRDQFLKAVQPSLDKYSSLTKAVLDKKLEMTLENFSKAEKLPDLKIAVRAFDKMLSDTMNGVLDKTFAAYMEYSQAVTDAHENAIPVLNAEMDAHLDELKEAGATDEDVQFFRDTLASRLRERMETEICNNPKAWLGQEGKDKAATFFKETLDALKMEMSMMRLDPSKPEAFETQVRFFMELNGFREFMDDDTTKAAVLENIKTWLKGDSVQQLMVEFRRAQMVTRVYGNDSGTQAVKDAKEVFNKFHAGIRAAVVGIQATILQGEFKNTQLEPALKLFDMWLEKYDLPTTPISRGKESLTLREMAKEHFTQRVHDLQQRMAKEGKVAEPLLSQEYLVSFLQFINEHGTSVMLKEMEEKVKAKQMQRITGNSKSIYELDDIFSSERSTLIREAVLVNNMGLRKLMDLSMAQIEKDIRSNPLSIEELQRWRDVIEARFENQMCNVNAFRMSCESRVMQMRQVSDLIPKGMLFLMEALKERFGGVNILSDEKIKSDPKLAGLVSDLHATLLNLMADKTAKKSEALQKIAHAEVKNPLEAQSMFLYDTEDNPALTNSFKDLARSLVKGASETKAYRNLFKQLDKKLGIKAK